MKKPVMLMLAVCSLLLCGCGDKAERKAKPTFMFGCFRKEIVTADYHIPDMAAPEAAKYLQGRLKAVPGYVDSTVDLNARILTVRYKSTTIRSMNIEEAIALSGFAVNNRPADPKAKLPEGLK